MVKSILIGTRKSAFILSDDGQRKKWTVSEPIFLKGIFDTQGNLFKSGLPADVEPGSMRDVGFWI